MDHSTLSLGGLPRYFFNFNRFYGRFNGFNAFGTTLQSLWIMLFFFLPKKIFLVE